MILKYLTAFKFTIKFMTYLLNIAVNLCSLNFPKKIISHHIYYSHCNIIFLYYFDCNYFSYFNFDNYIYNDDYAIIMIMIIIIIMSKNQKIFFCFWIKQRQHVQRLKNDILSVCFWRRGKICQLMIINDIKINLKGWSHWFDATNK